MKILIANIGDSIDSVIKKLINFNGNKKTIIHYKNDPANIREYITKHNYDIIAINCSHPRGKSIAALLHEKKNNKELSSTIVEVYKIDEYQTVKTYK